jgi:pimeloyl-ACP methyl ester carboxylesterase
MTSRMTKAPLWILFPLTLAPMMLLAGCSQQSESNRASSAAENAGPNSVADSAKAASDQPVIRDYASVNGLRMYYEIHGSGSPLVLLHGAFGVANVFPQLAVNRKLIAVELQGHGHTADIDRPLTFEQMADDTAALLKQLGIEQADFFGYSMGGNVGLAIAIRHPGLVRKLVVNGSNAGKIETAYDAASLAQFQSLPEDFAPPMLKEPYDKVAPDPAKWPVLVGKIKTMGLEFQGFSEENLRSIGAEVLITAGDRDVVRPEHAVEMFRLIPNTQLAIYPGADHFLIWQFPDRMFPAITAFLDAPVRRLR